MDESIDEMQSALNRAWLIAHKVQRANNGTEIAVDCERMKTCITRIERALRIYVDPATGEPHDL